MKFAFVTCVELGLACMREIYAIGGRLDLAVTLPDGAAGAKSGRVYLDSFCSERSIPLLKVRSINDPEGLRAVLSAEIDWLFVIGWSQIARRAILEAPRRGALGMHPTLLPEGRGRAPIPWAILKGLDRTGVTLFRLDEGVDTGDILDQVVLPIAPRETAATLYARAACAHRELIARAWPKLESGDCEFRKQDESRATVWPGRKPEDGEIRPEMSCTEADRLVRAVTRPYPGAFVESGGCRYRIWAGRAVPGERRHGPPAVSADGREFLFPLRDGVFAASEWERPEGRVAEGATDERDRAGLYDGAARAAEAHALVVRQGAPPAQPFDAREPLAAQGAEVA